MNKIKGLILKDLLELKTYKKHFLLSIIIYTFIILLNTDKTNMISVGISMIIFLCSTYAVSTFNFDEKSNSNQYFLTLGINKKDLIKSKYLLLFLSILTGSLIGTSIGIILYLLKVIEVIMIQDILSAILGMMFTLSILHGIQIPSIYKFGAEKGKLQIYLAVLVISLFFVTLYLLFPNIDLTYIAKFETFIPYVCIIFIIINYYISYRVACRIYQKKEL